jgi:hypothetical protein
MHPLLVNFSIFTLSSVIINICFKMSSLENEQTVISFLMDLGLIPSRDIVTNCVQCAGRMVAWSDSSKKLGFRFVCSNRIKSKCSGTLDPLVNTFFEKTSIPFSDILAIIFCFVLKLPASFV